MDKEEAFSRLFPGSINLEYAGGGNSKISYAFEAAHDCFTEMPGELYDVLDYVINENNMADCFKLLARITRVVEKKRDGPVDRMLVYVALQSIKKNQMYSQREVARKICVSYGTYRRKHKADYERVFNIVDRLYSDALFYVKEC